MANFCAAIDSIGLTGSGMNTLSHAAAVAATRKPAHGIFAQKRSFFARYLTISFFIIY